MYKGFSARRDYAGVAKECVTVVGGVLLIVGVAVGFTNYLVDAQLPALLIAWTQAHIHSKYAFLLLLNLVLLLKGSFMDVFSAIIVVVPLITPIAAAFGIEPVQLGIIFLSNLELGYLTPPVGMNLCLSAYRFQRPMASVYRATLPFYLILLAGVLLITYVPWITMAPVRWFLGDVRRGGMRAPPPHRRRTRGRPAATSLHPRAWRILHPRLATFFWTSLI